MLNQNGKLSSNPTNSPKGFIDERGQSFNSCDFILCHMYSSIAGRRRVSSSRPRRDGHTVLEGLADHLVGLEQECWQDGQAEEVIRGDV